MRKLTKESKISLHFRPLHVEKLGVGSQSISCELICLPREWNRDDILIYFPNLRLRRHWCFVEIAFDFPFYLETGVESAPFVSLSIKTIRQAWWCEGDSLQILILHLLIKYQLFCREQRFSTDTGNKRTRFRFQLNFNSHSLTRPKYTI